MIKVIKYIGKGMIGIGAAILLAWCFLGLLCFWPFLWWDKFSD